jgi:hypothetical protein
MLDELENGFILILIFSEYMLKQFRSSLKSAKRLQVYSPTK